MKNKHSIEITKENRDMYEELYWAKRSQKKGKSFFSRDPFGGNLRFDFLIAILCTIGIGIIFTMGNMLLLSGCPIIPTILSTFTTVGGYGVLCVAGIKKFNQFMKGKKLRQFKKKYPEIDTEDIDLERLWKKIIKYDNQIEKEKKQTICQKSKQEKIYVKKNFKLLSKEEQLEVLRIEREKILAPEEKELESHKIYQKSDDLKGFHEA